jgi:hypothetical protein
MTSLKITKLFSFPGIHGGAGRDRTDDLKLAKLPLSQLSYGPFLLASNAGGDIHRLGSTRRRARRPFGLSTPMASG